MELVITLLVIGGILLLLETVLPGLIAGIVGGCCLVAGVLVAYVRFGSGTGTWVLLATTVGLAIGFALWVSFFPNSRLGRRMMLQGVSGEIRTEQTELLQQTGTAATQLRPSGAALINGRRVDVVSEGPLIEKGTPIKVIATEGTRVVVRAISESVLPATENKTTPS